MEIDVSVGFARYGPFVMFWAKSTLLIHQIIIKIVIEKWHIFLCTNYSPVTKNIINS